MKKFNSRYVSVQKYLTTTYTKGICSCNATKENIFVVVEALDSNIVYEDKRIGKRFLLDRTDLEEELLLNTAVICSKCHKYVIK